MLLHESGVSFAGLVQLSRKQQIRFTREGRISGL
jgi:hypothetical protein